MISVTSVVDVETEALLQRANTLGASRVLVDMDGQPVVSTLLALQDRPEDRVAALFDAHHERLYRLARRLTPSVDDALDLVQETFLRAARSPRAVPFGSSPEEAWLVRVLINICRDQ